MSNDPLIRAFDDFLREVLATGGTNRVLHLSPDLATALQREEAVEIRGPGHDDFVRGVDADGFLLGVYGWRIPFCVRREWKSKAVCLDLDTFEHAQSSDFAFTAA